MTDLINQFLRYCSLEENLSPNTVRSINACLTTFLKRTDVKVIKDMTVEVLKTYLYEGKEKHRWVANTTLNHMKYLKKFLNWCLNKKYISKNPILEIKKPKQPKTLPRFLTKDQAKTVLTATFTHDWFYAFEKHRNYAMIATFLYTGIRASELINLKVTDVNLNSGRIFIDSGKGAKDRYVPIHRGLKRILESYLIECKRLKKNSSYFFVGAQSNLPVPYKRLGEICMIISKETGIKFTPHALRHTAATEFANQGLDVYKLSRVLGHSDIKTSTIYMHTAIDNLKKSVDQLDLYEN